MVIIKEFITESQFNKILKNWKNKQNKKMNSRKRYVNRFTYGVDIPSVMQPDYYKGNQFKIRNNNKLVLTTHGKKPVSNNAPKKSNYEIIPKENTKQPQNLSIISSKKSSPKENTKQTLKPPEQSYKKPSINLIEPPPVKTNEPKRNPLLLKWFNNNSPRKKNNSMISSTWFTSGVNVEKFNQVKKSQCNELLNHIKEKVIEYNLRCTDSTNKLTLRLGNKSV